MRYAIVPLILLTACNPDIIDHGNNVLGDSGVLDAVVISMDASPADVGTADAGRLDAGTADASPKDAGPQPCQPSVGPTEIDFGTVGEAQATRSFLFTNLGFGDCEVGHPVVSDPTMFSIVSNSTPTAVGSGDTLTMEVATVGGFGELEATIRIGLGRTGDDIVLPVRALRRAADKPSTQAVTLRIDNTLLTEDRWVHVEGWSCTPFDVGVPLSLGMQCGCECPPPPEPQVTRLRRIRPTERFEIEWDGRGAVTWVEPLVCAPDFVIDETHAALQPVAPGTYTVRIGVETAPAAHCNINGDFADCSPILDTSPGSPPPVAERCTSTAFVEQTFQLTAGQGTVVPLLIQN